MTGRLSTALLCGLAVFAPLAIGGVHPMVQVVLCALVTAWGLAELIGDRRAFTVSPLLWPALAACAWTTLQLLPLPGALVQEISPMAWALRTAHGATFMPLTVDVPATLLALMRITALTVVLCLGGSTLRSSGRARAVMWSVAAVGAGLCMLTAAQRMWSTQLILGFYTPRSQSGSGVFGTFVSGNHCASMAAMGTLAAAGLAIETDRGARFLALVCAALSTILVFLTMSRAGALGLGVGGFVLATTLLSRRFGRATGVLTACVLLVLATTAALWLSDGLRNRLTGGAQALSDNQKTRGWRDALALQDAYRWTGVGRGAFEAPLEAFRSDDEGVRLVYPENILLQRSTEWGLPFVVLWLGLIAWALWRSAGQWAKTDTLSVAAIAAVLAVIAHEVGDFGLEMLGVALPAAVLLSLVVGRTFGKRALLVDMPASRSAVLWSLLALATASGAWAAHHTLDADYRLAQASSRDALPALLPTLMARHPASGELALLDAVNAVQRRDPSALHKLNDALLLHPANLRAHVLAGQVLVALKRPAQAAVEFREAIGYGLVPDFASLTKLLGDHVIDAVPQRTKDLQQLAGALVNQGQLVLADRASQRAVELAEGDSTARNARLDLAVSTRQPALIKSAALSLVDRDGHDGGAASVDDYICAARALAGVSDSTEAERVLQRGAQYHTGDEELRLALVQLRIDRSDLAAASALLNRGPAATVTLSLEERQRAEELTAAIADRTGDVEGAVVARARARSFARQRGVSPGTVK